MVREIVKDVFVLRQISAEAGRDDMYIVRDLLDTVRAHSEECVGMAANMIGELKRIIAVRTGKEYTVMINPVITDRSKQKYTASEGCLCYVGERPAIRYQSITVEYRGNSKERSKAFPGMPHR